MLFLMNNFALVGIAIFVGILSGKLFDRIGIPEVVGIVLVGIILGESGLGLLTVEKLDYFKPLIDLSLAFFGFFIGAELKIQELRKIGYVILSVLLFETTFTFLIVSTGIYIYTREFYLALLLGSLAISTAPAATADVIWEYKASGKLTAIILALIGFDDIVTVFVYSIASNYVINSLNGQKLSLLSALSFFGYHIGTALILGLSFGIALTFLSKICIKLRDVFIIAIGITILTSGIAEILNGSEIIATMILGLFFSNRCCKAEKTVNVVRELSAPLFTIFFVLIGAKLNIYYLSAIGFVGIAYLLSRILGKFSGATLGAYIAKAEGKVKRNIGLVLYSQAGITLGLGSSLYFDLKNIGVVGMELGIKTINTLISATLILLVIGPILVKYALDRAGEVNKEGEVDLLSD